MVVVRFFFQYRPTVFTELKIKNNLGWIIFVRSYFCRYPVMSLSHCRLALRSLGRRLIVVHSRAFAADAAAGKLKGKKGKQ